MAGSGNNPSDSAWYDTAQVCLNGHVANASTIINPDISQKYCGTCGELTITACPNCTSQIPGFHQFQQGPLPDEYRPPAFCPNCGKPYPWTERRLQAARDLAQELDNLTDDERESLSKSLDDLVRKTPQTQVAVTRFKRLVAKAGSDAAGAFKSILVDIVSESVRKVIWGPH